MSSANTDLGLGHSQHTAAGSTLAGTLRTLARGVADAVRGVAFWAAVALPLASLVVLFAGPVTAADLLTLAGLLTANALALLVGHGHGAADEGDASHESVSQEPVTL